jgi:hypothetical protein
MESAAAPGKGNAEGVGFGELGFFESVDELNVSGFKDKENSTD